MRRIALALLLAVLGLALFACSGSAPVNMQLPAQTSIGTGAQANAWATAILAKMGAPSSDVPSIIAWFSAEDGGHPAGQSTYGAGENNPLNLTADSGAFSGVVGTEPSGVGPSHPGNLDFATPTDGVMATVSVIQVRYATLAKALTSGRGLENNPAVATDLARWSGDGYSSLP